MSSMMCLLRLRLSFLLGYSVFSIWTVCHVCSHYRSLLNTSLTSTLWTQRPSSFFPQEPAAWLIPLCPSSWGCLSFFQYTNQNTPPFCPKVLPAPASNLAGNLTFAVHGGISSLWSSDASLSPPQYLSAHPVPAWERLFPLLLSIQHFLWLQDPGLSSGMLSQIFPGEVDHFYYHVHTSTVDRTETLTRSHVDSVKGMLQWGAPRSHQDGDKQH